MCQSVTGGTSWFRVPGCGLGDAWLGPQAVGRRTHTLVRINEAISVCHVGANIARMQQKHCGTPAQVVEERFRHDVACTLARPAQGAGTVRGVWGVGWGCEMWGSGVPGVGS